MPATPPAAPSGAEEPAFLAACRRRPVARRPVWFMRQAGRSLPEYHEKKGPGTLLDVVRDPALAAELTLQPVRRYGVDAAILYSDIVVPVAAIGFGVEIVAGVGPVAERPFASAADLERLRPLEPSEDVPYVAETVRILVKELNVPLIGFAGAPFTVASYLIEGKPTRDFARTKALMYSNPELWTALMERLADITAASLLAQVDAGAAAIQLFDSWVGALSAADYRRYVQPATARVFAALADRDVPRIYFGVDTGELLADQAATGPEVVGVDWRVPISEARRRVGPDVAVQGNLDPAVCLAPWPVVEAKAREVLVDAGDEPGHIFNLGHGVLPPTDPGVLAQLVELVHAAG